VKFNIFAMKEPDYIMSVMSTYGTCDQTGKENKCEYKKDGTMLHATFLYPEVITNHFTFQDSVDANNRDRMFPIALKETWKTCHWPCHIFQFFLAVTDVNVQRAITRIYGKPPMSQQEF